MKFVFYHFQLLQLHLFVDIHAFGCQFCLLQLLCFHQSIQNFFYMQIQVLVLLIPLAYLFLFLEFSLIHPLLLVVLLYQFRLFLLLQFFFSFLLKSSNYIFRFFWLPINLLVPFIYLVCFRNVASWYCNFLFFNLQYYVLVICLFKYSTNVFFLRVFYI